MTGVDPGTAHRSIGGERSAAFIILLVFVFLTAAFYRDFSHLGISLGGTTIFVTELTIALIIGLLTLEVLRTGLVSLRFAPSATFAILFVLWGVVCLYRGRTGGMISLREYATNYYAIFYLLVALVAHTPRRLSVLTTTIVAGAILAFGIVLWRVVTGEGLATPTGTLRYSAPIAVGGASTFFFLAAPAATSGRRILLAGGACIALLVAVVATQHRSAAIAMVAAVASWIGWFHVGRGRGSIGSRKAVTIAIACAALLILIIPQVANQTVARFVSIGIDRDDADSAWRLLVWRLLFSKLEEAPLVGFGFGDNIPAFEFRGVTYGMDPSIPVGVHNSFLFVLYKEGLVGLILLVGFASQLVYRSSRSLRGETSDRSWIASASLAGFVFVGVFALFNVVLEGPYMSMLFWLYAGIGEGVLLRQAGDVHGRSVGV